MARHRRSNYSDLAMDNAPARTIQELAGHAELLTTQGYMHLRPSALNEAINLLESSRVARRRGENRETEGRADAKPNC
jgi:site-specific recombinase XerC